jgi:hypothetical protein
VILRRRFGELINRQLELFLEEHGELVEQCREALRGYDAAERDDAGEHYERFGDLQEDVNDALHDLRDEYAATLDERTAERYAAEFDQAAGKRLRGIWL